MLKHILASTALATLLAGGVYAQTDPPAPAADPGADAAAPLVPGADATIDPLAEPAPPDVVQDDSVTPDPAMPDLADDPAAAPADPLTAQDPAMAPADPMAAEVEWAPVDLATFSTDRLIGANVVTANDETIATIEDVLINDDGTVENVVAKFGGFLGFGANRVLLTMDEIEVMQDANENLLVRSNLTPESIEARPVYE